MGKNWLLVGPEGDIWEGDDPWTLASQAAPARIPEPVPYAPGGAIHDEWKQEHARGENP